MQEKRIEYYDSFVSLCKGPQNLCEGPVDFGACFCLLSALTPLCVTGRQWDQVPVSSDSLHSG